MLQSGAGGQSERWTHIGAIRALHTLRAILCLHLHGRDLALQSKSVTSHARRSTRLHMYIAHAGGLGQNTAVVGNRMWRNELLHPVARRIAQCTCLVKRLCRPL